MNTNKSLSLLFMMMSLAGCGGANGDMAGRASGGAPSTAQDAAANPADATATTSDQFLKDAFQDGLNEVQLSQLALQRSGSDQVKKFAQRMIDDHTRMNNEITQLAQAKNITLPTDVSNEQKQEANRLAGLSGDAFDTAYMSLNVAAHEKDVAAAKLQALQGNDAEVKTVASATAPILEIHLAAAREINSLLNPSAFLQTAYQDGLSEIALSQLALQKASGADVKQFAQKMVDEHTQANARIAALAQQKGVALASGVSASQQADADDLAKLSGVDFDKAYMDMSAVAHTLDVRQAQQQSTDGRDPDIKALAADALPTLQTHLADATSIDQGITPSFLYSAYQDGNGEIQLGHLALLQATDTTVKNFAQQMMADHGAANAQIAQVAQQHGVTLPTQQSPLQIGSFVTLMGKSGAGFDREYMAVNVSAHQKDVDEAAQQAQQAPEADVRTLAQNLLSTLMTHLSKAREVQQRLAELSGS